MNILITGISRGIGKAAAERFISLGHTVYGIDIRDPSIKSENYVHIKADIRRAEDLPDVPDIAVIVNNAGTQNGEDDIETNLKGAINVTEKYMCSDKLVSVLFNASASSVSGQEFPYYAASKAGLVGYMKNAAIRLAPRKVTCNAVSFGGVYTESNAPVTDDPELFGRIMDVTPMKKWTTLEETSDWIVFLTLTNRSMSGRNLLIDNGEACLNPTFVWPE